jgi:hypothetical protein
VSVAPLVDDMGSCCWAGVPASAAVDVVAADVYASLKTQQTFYECVQVPHSTWSDGLKYFRRQRTVEESLCHSLVYLHLTSAITWILTPYR